MADEAGFLLGTQCDDGSWWVRCRTWPFQPRFDGHFPHRRDQWISAAGTSWVTIALLLTIEPSVRPADLPNAPALAEKFEASARSGAMRSSVRVPITRLRQTSCADSE